jgi:hypothetical protein
VGAWISGTIEAEDGGQSRVSATGGSYEQAKAAWEAMIPEGHKLIVIRTL